MRGLGWGKKHSVVDYVWEHPYICLVRFHMIVIKCLEYDHGAKLNQKWKIPKYRGKILGFGINPKEGDLHRYPEHNEKYLEECIENLKRKGIIINEPKNQNCVG
jgi:uncharacterized protein (TIGR02328 family)